MANIVFHIEDEASSKLDNKVEWYSNFCCNIFVFLFDIKRLHIFFVCFGGGVGYMHIHVDGALVFVHAGCD